MMIKNVGYVLFSILIYIDHVVMEMNTTLNAISAKHVAYLKAKHSQTSVSFLSLINPWLYLLSTICAHSCGEKLIPKV